MNLGLANQVVVVLGAASGIGRAIAHEFTNEGAHVVIVDRSPAVVEVAAELSMGCTLSGGSSPMSPIMTHYNRWQPKSRPRLARLTM